MKLLSAILLAIVIFVAGLAAWGKLAPANITNPEVPPTFVGKLIQIDNEKIRVYQKGTGPDLLMIHGLPGTIEDFQPFYENLTSRYRITSFDRPGYGFSTANNQNYNLSYNTDIAFKVIEAMGLNDLVVVGHSYGGTIALQMAAYNSEKIKSYVTIGSPHSAGELDPLYPLIALPFLGDGILHLMDKTGNTITKKKINEGIMEAFFPNEVDIPANFIRRNLLIWSQPKVAQSIANESINLEQDLLTLTSRYSGIQKPVYVTHGDADQIVPVEDAQAIAKSLPRAEMLIWPNVGHYAQFVEYGSLLQIIDSAASN